MPDAMINDMAKLLIVCEHPALHTGFASVGRNIAVFLSAKKSWDIDFLGRFAPPADDWESSFRTHSVDPDRDFLDASFETLLKQLIGGETCPSRLLSIGTGDDQLALLDLLDHCHLRQHVFFIAYFPVDYAPLPPLFGQLLARADLLVPYSQYAMRTMHAWCARAGQSMHKLAVPIPHGVCTETFQPSSEDDRRRMRRNYFAVDETALVVGFFGRNSGHKRSELAIRIFQLVAKGLFARCRNCERIEVSQIDPIDFVFSQPHMCRKCGSHNVATGIAMPNARLYMHTDQHSPSSAARFASGGWDLQLLARRLGISDQIIWGPDFRNGCGIQLDELAQRISACDIHLLPYEAGGWELTVLESGACGVSNVITDLESLNRRNSAEQKKCL